MSPTIYRPTRPRHAAAERSPEPAPTDALLTEVLITAHIVAELVDEELHPGDDAPATQPPGAPRRRRGVFARLVRPSGVRTWLRFAPGLGLLLVRLGALACADAAGRGTSASFAGPASPSIFPRGFAC
jgi:hypothetical protein